MLSQNYSSKKWFLLLACVLLFVSTISCGLEAGIVEPTNTPRSNNEVRVIDDVLAEITETPNQDVLIPQSSTTGKDCQTQPFTGLIFGKGNQNGESLWQVGTCGELNRLSNQSRVQVSPSGKQALYIKDNDIWIVDLLDGSQRNLTNTPDRVEVQPRWWQGQEDIIVFGSWATVEELGPTSGYLSLISTDGSNYRVLVDQPSNAVPAPKPNEQIIAYDLGGTAWLYHLDSDQEELFDVSLYGLNIHKGMKIGSPAWSSDGKHLTWWVGGVFSPPLDGSVALAVFDLETKSVEILHPYTPIGSGGWLPAPIWSPDGKWIATMTLSEAHKTDLWVIRADGGEEQHLGFASNPVWNPDSQSLVYSSISEEGVKHVEVGMWEPKDIDLPSGSVPMDWKPKTVQITKDLEPSFEGEVYFATSPEMTQSRLVFPYGTPQIFAIWSYSNMRQGLIIRREWYLDEGLWLVREEPWDFSKYGANGVIKDISIYDFDNSLEPGTYQLRLYIDGQEQPLGNSEVFSSAYFEVSEPGITAPILSPDFSIAAVVEPPGTLTIQNVADDQDKRTILIVNEITSLAWYSDGTHIIYSVRDRSNQVPGSGSKGFVDELWIVNLVNGVSYPLTDQIGQKSGINLHDPYISPDGRYIAAIEGNGWVDACYVASNLWVKQVAFNDGRLGEIYSYYQNSFNLPASSDSGEMYVERIIGWDSPTLLKAVLKWTCTQENLDGIYLLDLSTLTAEKIGESE